MLLWNLLIYFIKPGLATLVFLPSQIIRILIDCNTRLQCVAAATCCCNAIIQSQCFQHETFWESPPLRLPCHPHTPHTRAHSQWVCVQNVDTLWQRNNEVQQCGFEYAREDAEMFWRAEPTSAEPNSVSSRLFSSCTSEKPAIMSRPPSPSHTESADSLSVTLPSRRDLCVFAHRVPADTSPHTLTAGDGLHIHKVMNLHWPLESVSDSKQLDVHVPTEWACAQCGVEPLLPIHLHWNVDFEGEKKN